MDDNQPLEGPNHSSPAKVCQQSHSTGYEPSSVTGHEPIVMTISTSGAKVHNPKDTHSQMDWTRGSKQRSSSSESSHETWKKKKKRHKMKKSVNQSPAPKAISFTMHLPPDPMVKDYNRMLDDTAGDAAPDQSNPRVIIIDEPSEGDETSCQDRSLGNPFIGPGDTVAGPYGHGVALPPSHSQGSGNGGDKNEDFCTMVQILEGIIPLSRVTADNDPHSEVLFSDNFTIPEGSYPAPYVLENFQGLFLPKPGAPGLLTSLRDHPLHCHGHSYTEGSDRVRMYHTWCGLVETGIGYTETVCIVRRGKQKLCTGVRKYNDLFKQSGYQAATVDTWGSLHFLPLITSVFLSHHKKSSFMNQLDSGIFGFDKCKEHLFDDQTDEKSVASNDPYQAYVITPIVKGGFHYVGIGLVYKLA